MIDTLAGTAKGSLEISFRVRTSERSSSEAPAASCPLLVLFSPCSHTLHIPKFLHFWYHLTRIFLFRPSIYNGFLFSPSVPYIHLCRETGQISRTELVTKHQSTTLKCQWNSKGALLFLQFALNTWFWGKVIQWSRTVCCIKQCLFTLCLALAEPFYKHNPALFKCERKGRMDLNLGVHMNTITCPAPNAMKTGKKLTPRC